MKRLLMLGCLMTLLFTFESFGQEPLPIGDGSKKPAKSASRSGNHSCYATIYFHNTGCKTVEVYYESRYGKYKHFGSMHKSKKWGVYTYPGDKWIFKVDNHQVFNWSVPRCYKKTITVDSKGCYGGGGHNQGYCKSYDYNCEYLHCTYKKDYNKYYITGQYNGDYKVNYWTLNGQKKSGSNKSYTWTVPSYGTYNVCTYYWCNGETYKCCKEIKIEGNGHGGGHNPGNDHCDYKTWYTYPNNKNYKKGSRVYVKVEAKNHNYIQWMKLYVNEKLIRQESSYPYEWGKSNGSDHYLYNMKPGHYKCKVEIKDKCGHTDYKYHEFWVKNGY